jgi:hypothetical protein
MKSLECDVMVDENHTAVVHLPDEISPGHHTLHIILHEQDSVLREECPEVFPTVTSSQWPQDLSLRREDLYDNDGR